MDFKNMDITPKVERTVGKKCVKRQESVRSSCAEEGSMMRTKVEFPNNNKAKTLVHMNSIAAYSDLLSNSSSLDESVDSGISSTPLTSSSYSFCSNNPLSNNLQKFREMKISQNSLDHYSNHPSNYTRYIRTLKFCLNKEKKTNSVLELTEKTN